MIPSCWLIWFVLVILSLFHLKPPAHIGPMPTRRRKLSATQTASAAARKHAKQPASRSRYLSLAAETKPAERQKASRARELTSSFMSQRLQDAYVTGMRLPKTDLELNNIVKKRKRPEEEDETDSGSTSSEMREEGKGKRDRTLRKRPRRQLQQKVDLLMQQTLPGKSLLETAAVSSRAREQYNVRWIELQSLAV